MVLSRVDVIMDGRGGGIVSESDVGVDEGWDWLGGPEDGSGMTSRER
jgi:hypothetical protein